jgi:ribosome-binding factor A
MGNRRFDRTKASSIRGPRLEELIRQEMNSLLESEINDRELDGVRITTVELSHDVARARLWYTMNYDGPFDVNPKTERAFQRASGFLRRELCDSLSLKRTPELQFRRDPSAPEALLLDEDAS